MSRVLDAIRAQYPELDTIDDRQIALALGKAQPDLFDQDPSFAEEFKVFEEEDRITRGTRRADLRSQLQDVQTGDDRSFMDKAADAVNQIGLQAQAASQGDIGAQIGAVQTFLGNVVDPPTFVPDGEGGTRNFRGPAAPVADVLLSSGRAGQDFFGGIRNELEEAGSGLNAGAVAEFSGGITRSGIGSMPALLASPAGLPAVAAAAGLQQLGGTFEEAVKEGMKPVYDFDGNLVRGGLSREEAERDAMVPAGVSGLTTAMVTALFGKTGIEKSLASNFKIPNGFAATMREVLKQMGAEGAEEATDESLQSLWAKQTFRPDMTVEEGISQVLFAAVAGGLLGGFFSGVNLTAGRFTDEGKAALLNRTIDPKDIPRAEGDDFAFPVDSRFPETAQDRPSVEPTPTPFVSQPVAPEAEQEDVQQPLEDFVAEADLGEPDEPTENVQANDSQPRVGVSSLRQAATETGSNSSSEVGAESPAAEGELTGRLSRRERRAATGFLVPRGLTETQALRFAEAVGPKNDGETDEAYRNRLIGLVDSIGISQPTLFPSDPATVEAALVNDGLSREDEDFADQFDEQIAIIEHTNRIAIREANAANDAIIEAFERSQAESARDVSPVAPSPTGLPTPAPTIEDVDRASRPPDPIQAGLRPRQGPAPTESRPQVLSRPPEPEVRGSLRAVAAEENQATAPEAAEETGRLSRPPEPVVSNLPQEAVAPVEQEQPQTPTERTVRRLSRPPEPEVRGSLRAVAAEENQAVAPEVVEEVAEEVAEVTEESDNRFNGSREVIEKFADKVLGAITNLAGPSTLNRLVKEAVKLNIINEDDADEIRRIQKDLGSKEDTSDAFSELEGFAIDAIESFKESEIRQQRRSEFDQAKKDLARKEEEVRLDKPIPESKPSSGILFRTADGEFVVEPGEIVAKSTSETPAPAPAPEPVVAAEPLPSAPTPAPVPGVDIDPILAGIAASVAEKQAAVDEAEASGASSLSIGSLTGALTKRRNTAIRLAKEKGFTEAQLDQAVTDIVRNARESSEVVADEERPEGRSVAQILIDAGLNDEDIRDLEKFSRETNIVDPVGDAKRGMIFFGGDWVVASREVIRNKELQEKLTIEDAEQGRFGSKEENDAAVEQARRETLGAKRQYNQTLSGKGAPVRTGEKLRNDVASLRVLAQKISEGNALDNEETIYLAEIYEEDENGNFVNAERKNLLEEFVSEADQAIKVNADTEEEQSLDKRRGETPDEYRERIFGIAQEFGIETPGLPTLPNAAIEELVAFTTGDEVVTLDGESGTVEGIMDGDVVVLFENNETDFIPADQLRPVQQRKPKKVKADPVKTGEAQAQVQEVADRIKNEIKNRKERAVQKLISNIAESLKGTLTVSRIPDLDFNQRFILEKISRRDKAVTATDIMNSGPRAAGFRTRADFSNEVRINDTLDMLAGAGILETVVAGREFAYQITDSGRKAVDLILTHKVKPGEQVDADGNITKPEVHPSLKRTNGSTLEPEGGSLTTSAVNEAISDIRQNWERGSSIEVVETPNQLPQSVQDAIVSRGQKLSDIEGAVDDSGTIHLVAGNIGSARRARQVVFHEAIGHYGIGEALGSSAGKFMNGVFEANKNSNEISDIISQYNLDPSTAAGRQTAGSEFVARAAENGNFNTIFLWDALVGKVRRWLRQGGFNLTVTDGDVRRAIARAADLQSRNPNNEAVRQPEPEPEPVDEIPVETPTESGKDRIRNTVNNQPNLLSYQTVDSINALLDTDILTDEQWNLVNLRLEEHIESAPVEGSIEMDAGNILVRILNQADPEVFPHEIFHLAYETLPESEKAAVNAARLSAAQSALNRFRLNPALSRFVSALAEGRTFTSQEFIELSKGQGLSTIFLENGKYAVVGSDDQARGMFDSLSEATDFIAESDTGEFVGMADGSESEVYHLINPSEFLAGYAGNRFAADVNRSGLRRILDKVRDFVKRLISAVRGSHRFRADVSAVYDAILAGKYTNNLRTGGRFERAYSVGATGAEKQRTQNFVAGNAAEAQRMVDAAKVRGNDPVRIQKDAIGNQIGEPIEFLRRHTNGPISDLGIKGLRRNAKKVLELLGFNELEKIESVVGQSRGYRTWAATVGAGSPINAVMAREAASKFNSLKGVWRSVKKKHEDLRKKITSPAFVRKLALADAAEIKAQAQEAYLRDFDAHVRATIQRATDAKVKKTMTVERAQVLLAEARELRDLVQKGPHRAAVSNAISDIIFTLTKDDAAVNFLLNNHQDPNLIANEYRKARRRLQQVDGRAEIDDQWVRQAAGAIARTEGKVQDMIVATLILNDQGFRAGLTAYQEQLFNLFEKNPDAAMKTILSQRGKWTTKADRTHQAFRRVAKPLEDAVMDYINHTRAANIITAMEQDPDIRIYDNIVNREAQEEQRPDYDLVDPSNPDKTVRFEDMDYWRLGERPIIHRPNHQPIQINFEAKTEEFDIEINKLAGVLEEWRLWKEAEDLKPEVLRDPYYEYFTNYAETVKSLIYSTMATDPAISEKLIALGSSRLMNNAEALVDELQTRISALAKNSSQVFKRTNRLARNLANKTRGLFVLKANEAARSMGFDKHTGVNQGRNAIEFYSEVIQPLLAFATNKDFSLQVGMVVGKGHELTKETVDFVRFMDEIADAGFKIVQKQIPKEKGHAFAPVIKQRMENLGYTSFGRSIRTGEITVPMSGLNSKAVDFFALWNGRRKAGDPDEARRAVGKEWDLIFSYMEDRASVLDTGRSPLEEAYAYMVERVQTKTFGHAPAEQNIQAVAVEISAMLSSAGVSVSPTDVQNQILNEIEEVLENFGSNVDERNAAIQNTSADKSTSFTERRGARSLPYYFLNYGWQTTHDLNGFFGAIHSFAYGNFASDLAAAANNLREQKSKASADYRARLKIIGDTNPKDNRRIREENLRDRLNGKTILNIDDIDRQIQAIEYQLENLNKVFGAGGNDIDFDTRIRHNILSGMIGGVITGVATTIRNATPIGYTSKHFGTMQDSVLMTGSAGMIDLFWEGWVKHGMSIGVSAAKATATFPVYAIRGAKRTVAEAKKRKGVAGLSQSVLFGILESLKPVYQEIESGVFERLERYRFLNDNGLVNRVDIIADAEAEIEMLFNGGIIEDNDITPAEAVITAASSIFDAFVLGPISKGMFPRLGDSIANIGVTKRVEALLREQERKLQRLWKVHKDAGTLNSRFDLSDPASRNNRLVPEELFSKHLLSEAGRQQKFNFLEQAFEKTGKSHQEHAIAYIAELERTGGSPDVRLIDPGSSDFLSLMSMGLEAVNVASAINRPWWTRTKSTTGQILGALQGWNATTFRNFSRTLSRPMKSGIKKKTDSSGRPITVDEVNNADARRMLMWATLTASTGIPILLMNVTQSVSAEELVRLWMRKIQNQERGTRQFWEHDTDRGTAWAMMVQALEPIPYVASLANATEFAAGRSRRASFDLTPLILAKVGDIFGYISKAFQTNDATYGLERIMSGMMPIIRPLTSHYDSQKGLNEAYNATRLFSRYGNEELLRGMSIGSWTADEMTPFGNRMVNAAMLENDAELIQLFHESLAVAKKLKRKDPVASVRQSFVSRNPYSRAFKDRITPAQRAELLGRMNERERAIVEEVEKKFLRGASIIGARLNLTDTAQTINPRPRGSSSRQSNRVPRQSLRSLAQ